MAVVSRRRGRRLMIIILEGPDGSGKTTLANIIQKQTGYELIHFSNPTSEIQRTAMFDRYVAAIKGHKNLILDRSWYSEMVYGPILREASCINHYQMYELEKLLAKKGALVIYASADIETLWSRCEKRGEDLIKDKVKLVNISKAYDRLFSIPHIIPVLKYEYKDM